MVIEDSADHYYHGPQKSPDGQWLAFTKIKRFEHEDEHNDWLADISLYVQNIKTGRLKRLVRVRGRRNVPVTAGWSPDSRRVIYWSLYSYGGSSVNADGSGLCDVSIMGGRPRKFASAKREEGSYAFSPNGRFLAVVAGGWRFLVSDKRIAAFDYRTGARRWLTKRSMASIDPVWSRNSHRLAFVATRDDYELGETDDIIKRESRTHLWVVDSDATNRRQLTKDPRYHEDGPKWAKDGRTIRFQRADNWKGGYLSDWEIRADVKALRRVLENGK